MICRKRNMTSQLRHKLVLQQEIRTADDIGGYTRTWKDIVELWAEITPLSGSERMLGGKAQSELTHKIRLRYRSGIAPGMRILFDKRTFNIRSVINVQESNEILEILAEEGVAT